MESPLRNRLHDDAYLDVLLEWGNINDIPPLIEELRAQFQRNAELRTEVEALREQVFAAFHQGAKTFRGAAKQVALMHNAAAIAEDIEGLPLPGQSELGGFHEH